MKNNKFKIFKVITVLFLIIPTILIFSACSTSSSTTSISISSDGYWVINGTKTNTKAEGQDGKDGEDGKDAHQFTLRQAYNELVENGYSGNFSDFLKEYFDFSADLTSEVAKECKTSIVSITRKNSSKSGSGIVIKLDNNGNGYILTNYHVCYPNASSDEFRLVLASDENAENVITASYVDGDENLDLAILKVENNSEINNATPTKFANNNATDGDTCIAIGNTHSKGIAITIGNVSKDLEIVSYNAGTGSKPRTVLRHCAYIAKGSSGGGLFNLSGELIGVTNAGEDDDQTLMNYAIPIEIVSGFVNKVLNNF